MDSLLIIGSELARDAAILEQASRQDYAVELASGRSDGLERLRALKPAVVMVDHDVEGGRGVALLKELRGIDPNCQAILVTDGGAIDDAIEVLRAGALDYMKRPVDTRALQLALGRARERRQSGGGEPAHSILIAEDHEAARKRLAKILSREGYRVHTAADGEEALRIFRDSRIDLIIADIQMPKLDGLSLLRETRGQGADVEVIVATGYGEEDAVVEALREGAVNFLRKPIDLEQTLLAIEKALEHQATRRALAYRDRDVALMQELLTRLTRRLEQRAGSELAPESVKTLWDLADALPFGIAVVEAAATANGARVHFCNEHVRGLLGVAPEVLALGWLQKLGLQSLDAEHFESAFGRVRDGGEGCVERLEESDEAFLLMTPVRLKRGPEPRAFVVLVLRAGRRLSGASQFPPG
ncbi:MAG: response regulator [Myxococcales bacterium]|nr:response regulator [Myxococcales bacterium]